MRQKIWSDIVLLLQQAPQSRFTEDEIDRVKSRRRELTDQHVGGHRHQLQQVSREPRVDLLPRPRIVPPEAAAALAAAAPVDAAAAAAAEGRGEEGAQRGQVRVRVSGERRPRWLSIQDRQQQLAKATELRVSNTGGNEETQMKHVKWRVLWEEAMKEMQVPVVRWYQLDIPAFQQFSTWALVSLNCEDLDVFTTMLNKEHRRRTRRDDNPWRRQESILEEKEAYRASRFQMREQQREEAEAEGRVPAIKTKRVNYPDEFLRRVIDTGLGLTLLPQLEASDCRLLAVLSWLLLTVLFAVRASTLGAMKSEADVYAKDGKLCLVLHHIKWWRHGKQSGTNRRIPLVREGRYGIPFEVGGDSWRDLAVRIIFCARDNGVLMLGTERGYKGAADIFNRSLKRFGFSLETEETVSTSHSGRKTCISSGSALGVPMAVLREWMLVLDDVTVETYAKGEANFMPGPVTSQLLDFLKGLN
jgi:hypothetical protein